MGKVIALTGMTETAMQLFTGINLSLAIALHLKAPAAFVDLSFRGNEMEVLRGEEPGRNIMDLYALLSSMDAAMLKSYVPIARSGIAFIGGLDQQDKLNIDPVKLINIITLLSSTYPYTIINTGHDPDPHLIKILDSSNLILMLTPPDLLSVRFLSGFISSLKGSHVSLTRLKPVVIRARGVSSYLSTENVEHILGIEGAIDMSYELETIAAAINSGVSPLSSMPHSLFSRGIKSLADQLTKKTLYPESIVCVTDSPANADPEITISLKDECRRLKSLIHEQLIATLDRDTGSKPSPVNEYIRDKVRNSINDLLAKEETSLNRKERARLVEELLDEVLGLGCLEKYLDDPEVTEIMVNGPETIFIEKNGKICKTESQFTSAAQLLTVIDRIIFPLGRRVDESSPLVDARLADGSRVNVIIPPLSLVGPAITIRKFSKSKMTTEDLINAKAASPQMMEFLKLCVLLRKNIVISGGTGSGKTTLLNIISAFIPDSERIVTLEDSAELQLPQDHVIRLESRRPSVEGTGGVSIRDLLVNTLRMRPDRIIVGECRAGETLDMLQAMNTGHDGSLTTIHSNSPRDAIHRISTMTLMSGAELSEKAIREQIASAIHIIVQLSRLSDGSRKIVNISEVTGIKDESVVLQSLFVFEQSGIENGKVTGSFMTAGKTPSFEKDIITHAISYDPAMFMKGYSE